MSVTIALTERQRTDLLLAIGLARESASVYELYAAGPVKFWWTEQRDLAQDLFDLVNEARRDPDWSDLCMDTLTKAARRYVCSKTKGHDGDHIDRYQFGRWTNAEPDRNIPRGFDWDQLHQCNHPRDHDGPHRCGICLAVAP